VPKQPPRSILHVDMDAFYASVEQRDRPELRGQPVLVGGGSGPDGARRGVVAAASYEARPFGCRSAMPLAVALRVCPHAAVVPVRMSRYREVSRQVFAVFDEFSPLVEPLSIDEAFLDLSGTDLLLGQPPAAAARIKRRLREAVGLPASVGVAPNKFLAKLASELGKPDGLFEIPADRVQAILDPLPLERLWGVGAATLARFHRLGLRVVRDVRLRPPDLLRREFGSAGVHFHRLANGLDDRPVTPEREAKSFSHETTFGDDIADPEVLRTVLLHQVEDVAWRLRRSDKWARTVSLKLRSPDFTTVSRSETLPEATQTTSALANASLALFDRWLADRSGALRLLGFGVENLCDAAAVQPSLFDSDNEKQRSLDTALDALRDRFGPDAVRRRPSR
jgi:DNA polymerase-4